MTVRCERLCVHPTEIADAAAAIAGGIAVEHLAPAAGAWHAEPIGMARHRREVAHHERRCAAFVAGVTQERDHAVGRIAAVDPRETRRIEVLCVQRRRARERAVEIAHPCLQPGVHRVGGQVPVEALVVIPLAPLAEFTAHEQQLLARVRPHVAQQAAEVGEALPVVARHLADQRALAVYDFVMRQGQHEVLVERVPEAERQLAVMKAAVDRIAREVLQRVVHPAHVPLEPEAQATEPGRPRHLRPRRGFLGHRLHVGVRLVHRLVELAQQGDRLEILASAMHVGHPLAGFARVVEIEHRGDAVDAQPVDVVAVEPEQRARQQERAYLVAAVVEDAAVPLRVVALPRVRVLVQVRAVEQRKAVRVARKVRGHPVHDHAQAALMQVIDQRHEILWRAVAGGWREIARGLVSPRSVERMLGDRHQLDVREAEIEGIVREQGRDLAVAQQTRRIGGIAPP